MALQIYKSGQGRYVRVGTAIGAVIVTLVLAYYTWLMLDRHLPGLPKAGQVPADIGLLATYKMYVEYAIPAVLLAVLCGLTAYFLNKAAVVDFLIATESEMKKVSWSSRAELFGSTTVVIVTVLLLALVIYIVDYVFIFVLTRGLGLW